MTQATTQDMPPAGEPPAAGQKNTWGLIGFILSLVALITCGVLSIVSLIVSVVGLFKRPKGFAIAGTLISLVGLVLLVMVGAGIIAGLLGLQQFGGQAVALEAAKTDIPAFYAQHDRLPTKDEVDRMIQAAMAQAPEFVRSEFKDNYEYEVLSPKSVRLTFPGFDDQIGNDDDISETITVP